MSFHYISLSHNILYYISVEAYLEEMTCYVGSRDTYVQTMMSEIAGFTGCELTRRCYIDYNSLFFKNI